MTTFITNIAPRPKPADMRGIDPHAIYREAWPAAVNQQAIKPAHAAPALLVHNTPKRPDEFAGYSINAAIDEAIGVAKPAQPKPAAATGDDFAGYSINSHMGT